MKELGRVDIRTIEVDGVLLRVANFYGIIGGHGSEEAAMQTDHILGTIKDELEEHPNLPTLLLGDLNAEPGSAALDALTGGRLADAYSAADKRCRDRIGTFTGFPTSGLRAAPRIDHILVDGGEVLWYCTEEKILDGFYMSDHLPVYIALMP